MALMGYKTGVGVNVGLPESGHLNERAEKFRNSSVGALVPIRQGNVLRVNPLSKVKFVDYMPAEGFLPSTNLTHVLFAQVGLKFQFFSNVMKGLCF